MLKKAIACLLVLAGVCSFHTSAADSKNEQFVNVNVFNKVYYGTVTKNADAGEAIFTPAEDGMTMLFPVTVSFLTKMENQQKFSTKTV